VDDLVLRTIGTAPVVVSVMIAGYLLVGEFSFVKSTRDRYHSKNIAAFIVYIATMLVAVWEVWH